MPTSTVQTIKMAIVAFTGLEKDALHIYVGLGIFFAVAFLSRNSIKTFKPLLAVLIVAVLGELLDMRDDLASLGYWRWGASLHDIVNTLFWPAILFSLARATTVFGERSKPSM